MLEPSTQPNAAAELNELRAAYESLRQVLNIVLVLCLIISGTLNLYFLRQSKNARLEAAGLRQMVAEYNKTAVPAMKEFVTRLADFGRTHPDFVPVLAKYGINPNAPVAAPGTPAPKTGAAGLPAAKR